MAGIVNEYFAHYINHEQYSEFLKTKNPIQTIESLPHFLIRPIEYFDSFSFRAYLFESRIPFNNESPIFRVFDGPQKEWFPVKFSSLSSKIFYIDYKAHKSCYFTFDGISFYKLLDVRSTPGDEFQVHLRIVQNDRFYETNTAFMVMPFRNIILNEFYKANVRDYLKSKLNLIVKRADDFTDNDVIIESIYNQIQISEFIICEITECNKNVFYEIGYSKGIGKEIIFISQRKFGKDLNFFDVSHIRRIEYDLENPEELQSLLVDTIKTIREKKNQN